MKILSKIFPPPSLFIDEDLTGQTPEKVLSVLKRMKRAGVKLPLSSVFTWSFFLSKSRGELLPWAVSHVSPKLVSFLLKEGANPNQHTTISDICNMNVVDALHDYDTFNEVTEKPKLEIFQSLLDYGLDASGELVKRQVKTSSPLLPLSLATLPVSKLPPSLVYEASRAGAPDTIVLTFLKAGMRFTREDLGMSASPGSNVPSGTMDDRNNRWLAIQDAYVAEELANKLASSVLSDMSSPIPRPRM